MSKMKETIVSSIFRTEKKIKITTNQDAYEFIKSFWSKEFMKSQEGLNVLLFNSNRQVLGLYSLSKVDTSEININAKLVFGVALKFNASSIIVANIHSLGILQRSKADLSLAKRLKESGDYLDVILLDYLIITKNGFCSIKDEY
jgi:DNA repair protein RadC